MQYRRAFTLIELLTVVSIIAVLAAILFPVFARAKIAAKRAVCLSNVRQSGAAFHLYLADHDDMTPSLWSADGSGCTISGSGCGWEWWYGLFPYIKTVDVLYCYDRPQGTASSYNLYGQALGIKRYSGYGYNWGPISRRGGGLLGPEKATGIGTQTALDGVSASSVENVANVFAFGDTHDTPRMTVAISFALGGFPGRNHGSMRHGSRWHFAFVDGHAKSVKMRGGFMVGALNGRFAMPANMAIASKAYCQTPGAELFNNPVLPDVTNIPDGIECQAIPQWIVANYPLCAPGAGVGSNCLWRQ